MGQNEKELGCFYLEMEYFFDKSLWPLKSHLSTFLHVRPGTTSDSGGDRTNRVWEEK